MGSAGGQQSAQRKASYSSASSPAQGALGSKIMPPRNSDTFSHNAHTPNNISNSFAYSSFSALQQGASFDGDLGGDAPGVAILIRKLPQSTSIEALRTMLLFAKDLVNIELISNKYDDDIGFQTAVAYFHTLMAANEAQVMLDGKPNTAGQANMIVEVLGNPPAASLSRRNTIDHSSVRSLAQSTSPSSMAQLSRHSSRFNNSFSPMDSRSPDDEIQSSNGIQSIFSQPSIGNAPFNERARVSGKSMIDQDGADDETGDILRDPVAYMKNGHSGNPSASRRATNPQMPTTRFQGLSLSTSMSGSRAQNYMSPINMATPTSTMSPTLGPNTSYPLPNQYPRHSLPPVNPADQNPPCNTLYVGNLPIDTSEDELKAMFSKQRGYKRLCFRTKSNGPMCFVEFEDVSYATKALTELYGVSLHNSVKGGIRLSFSKNPLGVRAGQPGGTNPSTPMSPQGPQNVTGMGFVPGQGFSTASGPPPGLSAPPGLGMQGPIGASNMNSLSSQMNTMSIGGGYQNGGLGVSGTGMNSLRVPIGAPISNAAAAPGMTTGYPDYMLGR
ncbi:MAG: hypothetical protein Q9227_007360 [Pyrenula ochraceoflavens]